MENSLKMGVNGMWVLLIVSLLLWKNISIWKHDVLVELKLMNRKKFTKILIWKLELLKTNLKVVNVLKKNKSVIFVTFSSDLDIFSLILMEFISFPQISILQSNHKLNFNEIKRGKSNNCGNFNNSRFQLLKRFSKIVGVEKSTEYKCPGNMKVTYVEVMKMENFFYKS